MKQSELSSRRENGGRSGFWGSVAVGVAVWAASLLWFARYNTSMAAAAAGGAFYALVLAILAVWLGRDVPDDRLQVTSGRRTLIAWWLVACVELGWSILYGIAFGGLNGGIRVPVLTECVANLLRWQLTRGVNGPTLLNFFSIGLAPLCAVLALGGRPRELGLVRPLPRTRALSFACLLLPACFGVWGLARGRVTAGTIGIIALHSFLSNGFPEEAQCRGLFLPPLRRTLSTSWAVLIQGLIFGLIHFGGAIGEEGGDYLRAAAAAVALNFPMGAALGIVALRTGSLALPIAIHVSLHLMKDLVM